jgi:type I restriction enzyme, S subunit
MKRSDNSQFSIINSPLIPKGYKQTEIGVIPEDWDVFSILYCANRITDGEHITPKREVAGYYLLSARNIFNGRIGLSDVDYVGEEEYQRIRQRCNPEPGDVLISCSGTVGRVAIVPIGLECVMVRSAALVKPDPKKIIGLYLQYFLQSSWGQNQIAVTLNQGAQANLFLNHIQGLLVSMPSSLAEQQSIASALSDADALVVSLETLIAKKRLIKQGAMQELLTGKRRLPGFIGKWDRKKIGDVFDISAGGDLRKSEFSEYYSNNFQYPIYANAHTLLGLYGYCATSDYSSNAITVTARGDIGFAVFRNHPFAAIGRILVLLPKEELSCLFFTEYINEYIQFANESTGVPQLTAPQIARYEIAFPPFAEQSAIAAVLSDMDSELEALEAKLEKARAIKQGMMQELLTGRIRLV